jgi:hypothetical protein
MDAAAFQMGLRSEHNAFFIFIQKACYLTFFYRLFWQL